jgi:transposase
VAEALVTTFFCHFGVLQDLRSDHGHNFKSHLLQEVLQHLGVRKTRTTPLHRQSDGMVEHYIKTADKRL